MFSSSSSSSEVSSSSSSSSAEPSNAFANRLTRGGGAGLFSSADRTATSSSESTNAVKRTMAQSALMTRVEEEEHQARSRQEESPNKTRLATDASLLFQVPRMMQ
jgi:hypothetical protein